NEIFSKEDKETENGKMSPEVLFTAFLWKINYIEQEIEKYSKVAEETIKEVNDWFDKKKSQLNGQIDYMCGQMKSYLKTHDRKSLTLPSGTIGIRKQQDKVEIVDFDLFCNKATPDLLRNVPESFEPDMQKIKSHIKTHGDIPDGIDVLPQAPKFYYKLYQKGEIK